MHRAAAWFCGLCSASALKKQAAVNSSKAKLLTQSLLVLLYNCCVLVCCSEDDYRFASKHWPQKFSAKAIPIHGDWVWSKIKIKQGWATHRIYFIRPL